MANNDKNENRIIIIAASLLIIGVLFLSFCDKVRAEEMCTYSFNQEDAQKIILTTEKLQYCEQYATSLNTVIMNQDERIALIESANNKLLKALEAQEQATDSLKKVISLRDEQKVLVEKQAAKDIKNARRSGFIWGFGGGVITTFITALIGIILL